jgi:hypothetical protein
MNPEAFDAVAFQPPALLPDALLATVGIVPFYVSTHGYTSQPSDTPANTYFEARLASPFTFERSILGSARIAGRVAGGTGEIELINGDGFYNPLLRDYTIDGRRVVVKVGVEGPYGAFTTIFDDTAADWRRDATTVRLRLRDKTARLEVPIQTSRYAGTGGLEGGADLKDTLKPLTYGRIFNRAPVLLDAANQIYQVHDGRVRAVTAVKVRGARIVEVPASPGIGEYAQDAATGTFELGFEPDGPVACDVDGDATGGVYVSTTATIVRRILETRAAMSSADLDGAAFDLVAFLAPGEIGFATGSDPLLIIDALDALMAGIGGYAGPSRLGLIQLGVFGTPASAPVFDLDEPDIIEIEELALPDYANPPPQRITVGYQRNWAPSSDLIDTVTDADRAALSQEWRLGAAFSSLVAANFVRAATPPMIEGLFASKADADAEAARLLALYGPGRRMFRVLTARYLDVMELGLTGLVSHGDPSLGIANGWLGVVARMAEDAGAGTLELILYG